MTIITVKTGGIAADAVTDAKIADDIVGTEHLTANEVDTAALKGDAVTGAELADNAVNSEHYTDGSIDTAHLADGQVTIGKLATAVLTGATDIGAAIVDADLLLIDDGAGGTLRKTAASRLKTYVGGGITSADQWRLATSFTGDATPIASNLERVDTGGWGILGTGMSESSGIFTFPSTGIWFVKFRLSVNYNGNNLYATASIQVTTNNSDYTNISSGEQGTTDASANVYSNTLVETLIDCTNTTNVKVRFVVDNENSSANNNGSSSVSYTNMMFIRLGDT